MFTEQKSVEVSDDGQSSFVSASKSYKGETDDPQDFYKALDKTFNKMDDSIHGWVHNLSNALNLHHFWQSVHTASWPTVASNIVKEANNADPFSDAKDSKPAET